LAVIDKVRIPSGGRNVKEGSIANKEPMLLLLCLSFLCVLSLALLPPSSPPRQKIHSLLAKIKLSDLDLGKDKPSSTSSSSSSSSSSSPSSSSKRGRSDSGKALRRSSSSSSGGAPVVEEDRSPEKRLGVDQVIEVVRTSQEVKRLEDQRFSSWILFEDDAILVINKPCGILSQPPASSVESEGSTRERGSRSRNSSSSSSSSSSSGQEHRVSGDDISVVNLAREYLGDDYIGLVHRLDRPTSG
jgi:hypothetical protein